MKALVTGASGQLGRACIGSAPAGWLVTGLSRGELDVTDAAAVASAVDSLAPDLILNAAAFTAVDRAESEADLAFAANRDGPHFLAREAAGRGIRIVHVSTDFVFDGRQSIPYRPGDRTAPLNVYGASKLAGEKAVLEAAPSALIVRTAWLYAAVGRNFLTTILGLMRRGGAIRVVADQIGTPTAATSLAAAIWRFVEQRATGVMHYTDAGVASWYDFAMAIAEEGLAAGILRDETAVTPISTAEYPTAARRPAFSVLDCAATWAMLGAPSPHWRQVLRSTLRAMEKPL